MAWRTCHADAFRAQVHLADTLMQAIGVWQGPQPTEAHASGVAARSGPCSMSDACLHMTWHMTQAALPGSTAWECARRPLSYNQNLQQHPCNSEQELHDDRGAAGSNRGTGGHLDEHVVRSRHGGDAHAALLRLVALDDGHGGLRMRTQARPSGTRDRMLSCGAAPSRQAGHAWEAGKRRLAPRPVRRTATDHLPMQRSR